MTNHEELNCPIISNAAIYDRMFRHKPYTSCVQCLVNDQLKCHNCMQNIIRCLTTSSSGKRIPRGSLDQNKYPPICNQSKGKKTSRGSAKVVKEEKENLVIMSKYDWWLAERQRKNQQQIGIHNGWPRKLKSNMVQFQNLSTAQPRFERWERKLIDKLTKKKEQKA